MKSQQQPPRYYLQQSIYGILFLIIFLLLFCVANAHARTGDLLWAKAIGGSELDVGHDISIDTSGNVYTTGKFSDMVNFHPGESIYRKVSKGHTDIFISKRQSNGNFIWTRTIGGPGADSAQSIAVDGDSNVYTTGSFCYTVDFDPGPDTYGLTSLEGISPSGEKDVFISKLDRHGNFIWAIQEGGTSGDWGNSIVVDDYGSVYITGAYSDTGRFGTPPRSLISLVSSGNTDIFVAKYDSSGNLIWVKSMGGIGYDEALSIAVDEDGNVYTTGFFHDTVDFDPGNGSFSLTAQRSLDVYVSKLDRNGDFVWAKSFGGIGADAGEGIVLDNSSNIYINGWFHNTVDFDPGLGSDPLSSAGADDMFINKLDSSGNFIWAKGIGGVGFDKSKNIDVDAADNLYITGMFSDTVDFDPGAGTSSQTVVGHPAYGDVFIASFNRDGEFLWAKRMGGDSFDLGNSIAVNNLGDTHITGAFSSNTAYFNPSNFMPNLMSAGDYDIFIAKYEGRQRYLRRFYNMIMPAIRPVITPTE